METKTEKNDKGGIPGKVTRPVIIAPTENKELSEGGCKQIPLTQGKYALVDDEDFNRLNVFKWHAHRSKNTFYAYRTNPRKPPYHLKMHRVIIQVPEDRDTDHINGNGLDNRRSNLRIVTTRENGQNLHIKKTSQFPGVGWNKHAKKWNARLNLNGKMRHLGFFDSEIDASITYRVACAVLSGVQS